jgi:hypothetical protein
VRLGEAIPRAATWSGQAIARLSDDSEIMELWLNEKLVSFDR